MVKNSSNAIEVNKDIKDVNQNHRSINSDIKSTLTSSIHSVGGLITIDHDKKTIIDEINDRLEGTNSIQTTKAYLIEEMIDDAKQLCLAIEEWYEDDYNEALAISMEVGKVVAIGVVASFSPLAMGLIVGAVAAYNFYEDGYSVAESAAIGTVKGGLAIAGEAVGAQVTKGAGKVLSNGTSKVSSYADDLIRQVEIPNNVIQNRLKSVSNKSLTYDIYMSITQRTERTFIVIGDDFDRIVSHISEEVLVERRVKGQLITFDYEKIYQNALKDSAEKLTTIKNNAVDLLDKLSDQMINDSDIELIGFKKPELSDIAESSIDGVVDNFANELTDHMILGDDDELNIGSLELDSSFEGEILSQVKEGIISGLIAI